MKNDKLIEQLKKKYDGKSLKEVEKSLDGFNTKSHENRKAFIMGLYYLKCSTRYKEDKRYKTTSFENYALERHNIGDRRFRDELNAFVQHEPETKSLGVGMVIKIKKKCGAKKAPVVLKKIAAIEKEVKRPLDRQQINSVIWDNRKPGKEKKAKTGPTMAEFKADLNSTRKELSTKYNIIKEQADQIGKLQKTVAARDEMVVEYKASYASLLDKYEKLAARYEAINKAANPLAGFFRSNKFKEGPRAGV